MNKVIEDFAFSILKYIDLLRNHFQVEQSNYVSIRSFNKINDSLFEVTINIAPVYPLFGYFNLNEFEANIITLFNFENYKLNTLTVSSDADKVQIVFSFEQKIDSPLDIEIAKTLNYSQLNTLDNVQKYLDNIGWTIIFKAKYPSLYERANMFRDFEPTNDYYKRLLQQFESMNQYELGDNFEYLELIIYQLDSNKLTVWRNEDMYKQVNDILFRAADEGKLELIKYSTTIAEKYNINYYNELFVSAAEKGHLHILQYLMSLDPKYNIDPTFNDNDALYLAVNENHLDVVKYLLSLYPKYDLQPAFNNNILFRRAARFGYLDIMKVFMSLPKERGINPATNNNEALRSAIKNTDSEMINYLLSLPSEYGVKNI